MLNQKLFIHHEAEYSWKGLEVDRVDRLSCFFFFRCEKNHSEKITIEQTRLVESGKPSELCGFNFHWRELYQSIKFAEITLGLSRKAVKRRGAL